LIAIIIFVATTFYILLSGSWPANLVANRVAVPNGRVEKVDGNFVSGRVRLARVSERTWYLNLPALTPFAGHDYATNFPFTENPISAGGIWVGGGTAGNGCNGRPCWGDMQSIAGQAYGVSEPTKYGDPTAILTGTWGPNQTALGRVVVLSTQPTRGCCHEMELRLRTTISANNITGYEVYCSMISGNQYCHIASWGGPNGSYVNLDECSGRVPAHYLKDGDTLKAVVTGINPVRITAYINSVQIMQVEDVGNCRFSDGKKYGPWNSGNPGIGQYDSMDSNFSSYGWASFSATDGSL